MSNPDKGTVKVADLHFTFNVRRKRDEDRERMFCDLYKAGAKIPLIKVYRGTTEIHDGRSRFGGLKLAGIKEVEVEYVAKSRNIATQHVSALSENTGGSKPPTYTDIAFVVRNLLLENVSSRLIHEAFAQEVGATYPPSMVKRFISEAQSQIVRENVAKATEAVASGSLKVPEAEEKYDLKKGTLGTRIVKKVRTENVETIKEKLSKRSQANTRQTNTDFNHLLSDFQDGKVNDATVKSVFAHSRKLLESAGKSLDKLEARFAELGGTQGKAKRRRKPRKAHSGTNGKHVPRSQKGQKERPTAHA